MVKWVSKRFSGALGKAGKRLGVNAAAAAGFLAAAANSIPMFASMKDMDEKGKLLNAAFAVGGAVVPGGFSGLYLRGESEDDAAHDRRKAGVRRFRRGRGALALPGAAGTHRAVRQGGKKRSEKQSTRESEIK